MSAAFFFKRIMWLGKANSTVDFKTISFEKFIVWEIAVQSRLYRKSLLLANNKGKDQTAMMSKPAY